MSVVSEMADLIEKMEKELAQLKKENDELKRQTNYSDYYPTGFYEDNFIETIKEGNRRYIECKKTDFEDAALEKNYVDFLNSLKYEETSNEYQAIKVLIEFDYEYTAKAANLLGFRYGLEEKSIDANALIKDGLDMFQDMLRKKYNTSQRGRLIAVRLEDEEEGDYFRLSFFIESSDNSI